MDLLDSPFSRPFYFWLNSNLKVFVLISFNSKFHFLHYFRVFGQRSVRHSQYAYVVLDVAYVTSTRNPNLLFLFVYLLILLRVYDIFCHDYNETHRVEPSSSRNLKVSQGVDEVNSRIE